MKSKAQAGNRSWPRVLIGVVTWATRLLIALLIVSLAIIAYLTIIGVPDFITARIVKEFNNREQLGLSVERVRLYPPDIVWVEGVRVQGSRPDMYPFWRCDDSFLKIDWGGFPVLKEMLKGVSVKNGELNLRLHEEDGDLRSPRVLKFRDMDVQMQFEEQKLLFIRVVDVNLGELALNARGCIRLERDEEEEEERRDLREWVHTRMVRERLQEEGHFDSLAKYHAEYNDFSFGENGEVDLEFLLHTGDAAQNDIAVNAAIDSVEIDDMTLEDIVMNGRLQDRELNVSRFSFQQGANDVRLSLSHQLESKTTALKGHSTLASASVRKLLPDDLDKVLSSNGIEMHGPLATSFEFGPTETDEIFKKFSTKTTFSALSLKDLQFTNLLVNLERDGDAVHIESLNTSIDGGPISGEGDYNIETKEFSGNGSAEIDPDSFLSLIKSDDIKNRITPLELDDSRLGLSGSISGTLDDMKRLYCAGEVECKDFSYNDTEIEAFKSDIVLSNKVLSLDQLVLERDEGDLTGSVALDLNQKQVAFSVVSDCAPKPIAAIISSNYVSKLENISFLGPIHLEADGYLDYKNFTSNKVEATVAARKVEIKRVLAQEAVFRCRLDGRQISIYDLTGVLYDGTYNGEVDINLGETETNRVEYALDIGVRGMKFAQLMERLQSGNEDSGAEAEVKEVYAGKINGSFALKGDYGDGEYKISSGEYDVAIREGRLFKIPLLGGLSFYLEKLFPGFGYLSQTELESYGLFRGNRILLKNTELQGDVLTVKAHGDYYYDKRLDVDAKVVPMRKGAVASVMRILTFPVSKLFEFRLQGTLHDPEWSPVNLPRQLFLKFD